MLWAYLIPIFVLAVLVAVIPVVTSSVREDRRLKAKGGEELGYLPSDAGHPARWRLRRRPHAA